MKKRVALKEITIALAQSSSVRGNIELNIDLHSQYVSSAVRDKADLIIFPELSLTGYEPDIANKLKIKINDSRLAPLKKLSEQNGITIIAGAPVDNPHGKPFIGAVILSPREPLIYRKKYLHPGEETYFASGDEVCVLEISDELIGIAICADITNPAHPAEAVAKGATIYSSSVFITPNGIEADTNLLKQYAMQYNMAVCMANYSNPEGNLNTAGQSSAWDEKGRLIVEAKGTQSALVIARKTPEGWLGKIIDMTKYLQAKDRIK